MRENWKGCLNMLAERIVENMHCTAGDKRLSYCMSLRVGVMRRVNVKRSVLKSAERTPD